MPESFKCPVCGKPLTEGEYDKALGLWKDKQEHEISGGINLHFDKDDAHA